MPPPRLEAQGFPAEVQLPSLPTECLPLWPGRTTALRWLQREDVDVHSHGDRGS